MLALALESMQAVTKSKLGAELEALFQTVIDYRDNNLNDVSFDTKLNAITTFFHKNVAKKFMDIVWKNTGLHIAAVFFKPNFETSFCTWMCYGHNSPDTQKGTMQIGEILNGQANSVVNEFFATHEFSVDELIKIARSFDVEKGIIRPQFRSDMKKWIQCAIGFDISLGFLSKDYLPKNAGVEYLTARELTAIMLHEIGHNMNLIEHAADLYAHTSSFEALRAYTEKHATPKQAIELAKKVADIGKKAGFNVDSIKLENAATQAEKDLASCGKQQMHAEGSKCFLLSLIMSALTLLGEAMIVAADVICFDPTTKLIRGGKTKKVGDTVIYDRMWEWEERHADEFAMLHGYGADQVTSLEKINKFYNLLGRSESDVANIQRIEREGGALSIYTKLMCFSYAHLMMSNLMFRLYPPGSQRYREILNTTIKNLKKFGASAEYVNKYTKDIELILDAMDKMSKTDKYMETCMHRYKLFLKFVSIPSFIDWLTNGRVNREIAETLDDIQKLNNNLITYFGVKFDQLSKKD